MKYIVFFPLVLLIALTSFAQVQNDVFSLEFEHEWSDLEHGQFEEQEIFLNDLSINTELVLAKRTDNWEIDNWMYSDSAEFYYENGILDKLIYKSFENNNWSNSIRSIYEFDTHQNLILLLRQRIQEGEWINQHQSICEYDDNNNRTLWIDQKWEVDNWVNRHQTIDEYDENSNHIHSIGQS